MRTLKDGLVGVAEALAGAYIGVALFLLTGLPLTHLTVLKNSPSDFAVEDVPSIFLAALVGTFAFIWWIAPMGMFFGLVLKDRIRQWSDHSAWAKGAALGATLGLLTALLFAATNSESGTPEQTIKRSFVFLPLYCAVWCGGFAQISASLGPKFLSKSGSLQ
jgi:hypothetical protein